MRNYTAADSALVEKKLFTYYCALCGGLCLLTEESIDKLPVRRTDNAYKFLKNMIITLKA